MIRKLGLISGVAAVLLLGVTSSASAGTLDQQQTASNTDAGLFTNQSVAQTFTAGISGAVDQADLLLFKVGTPTNAVTVEVRKVSAGAPGTTALASGTIPLSAIPPATASFVPVTFATPAPVTAGTQYALVAYEVAEAGDAVGWRYQNNTDVYPGGGFFDTFETVPPVDSWTEQVGDDAGFKTYVGPAPPTPPSPTNTGTTRKKCKKKHKHHAASAKKHCKKKKHK
jgi:hypothetical protein